MHGEMMGIGAGDVWIYFSLLWCAVIGALILGRYPRHRVGWLFIATALSFALGIFSSGYALEAIVFNPDTLPAGEFAAWLSFWITMPGIAAFVLFLPLLFPNGQLPSPRWRPVGWLAVALLVAAVAVAMVTPSVYREYPNIRNPIGIDAWKPAFDLFDSASTAALLVLAVLTAAALFDRRRRAGTEERLQLRWFAFASTTVIISFVLSVLQGVSQAFAVANLISVLVAVAAIPTAAGVAILRYRLYEIDVIINRTVVYIGLTAVLAGLYTAAVALFQRMIVALTGESSDLAVVLTLFVLATVFTPLKNTLQSNADRFIKPVAPPSAQGSAIDDLVKLAELHTRGILTDDEFAAKKKQVLGI